MTRNLLGGPMVESAWRCKKTRNSVSSAEAVCRGSQLGCYPGWPRTQAPAGGEVGEWVLIAWIKEAGHHRLIGYCWKWRFQCRETAAQVFWLCTRSPVLLPEEAQWHVSHPTDGNQHQCRGRWYCSVYGLQLASLRPAERELWWWACHKEPLHGSSVIFS